MRKSIATITASLLIATAPLALAQQKGPKLEKMQQHLGLSEDQVEQIRQIKAEGGNREDIKAVLTEEQQERMREHRQQKKGQGQGKGPKLERMQQNLGLSDEQVEQMRQIKAEGGSREDIKAVLTEEQQQMMEYRKQNQGKHKGQGAQGSP
jgi:hypothetical protein